jgi:hypothetical protein
MLALLSITADWWRHRRREEDRLKGRAGWMPWPMISVLSLIAAAYCAALWIKGA